MLWIALVIVLGLVVGALIVTYGARYATWILLAVLAVLIIALVWYLRYADEAGTDLIAPEELALNNLQMTKQYRSSYRMTGRLVNRSPEHTLVSVVIEITASDCPDDGGDCIVIGEAERLINVEIPPGQARDVLQQYVFPRFVLQGELNWRYTIKEIKARQG